MPTDTLTYAGELTIVTCWCGIRSAVPAELYRHAKADPTNPIYCPLGHQFVYRASDADRLRRQLASERENATFWRKRLTEANKAHAATKGQLTKTRKRVANGVCPCCNRTFVQLGRHMANQHPTYAEES